MLFNTFFFDFSSIWPPKNQPKIYVFLLLFRKQGFCENRAPVEAKLLFFMFRTFKKRFKFDAETHSKKTSKKSLPKIDVGLHFGFQKPPKIEKIAPKALSKTSLKKEAMRLKPQSPQRNGRQAFWDPARPSNHLSND